MIAVLAVLAGEIKVKQFLGENLEKGINNWLAENPFSEIVDIKFSASATSEDRGTDALIILRRRNK